MLARPLEAAMALGSTASVDGTGKA
jgi:hypothetical protein